ncbi:MAG: U-box domain-containing protein [bacterium]
MLNCCARPNRPTGRPSTTSSGGRENAESIHSIIRAAKSINPSLNTLAQFMQQKAKFEKVQFCLLRQGEAACDAIYYSNYTCDRITIASTRQTITVLLGEHTHYFQYNLSNTQTSGFEDTSPSQDPTDRCFPVINTDWLTKISSHNTVEEMIDIIKADLRKTNELHTDNKILIIAPPSNMHGDIKNAWQSALLCYSLENPQKQLIVSGYDELQRLSSGNIVFAGDKDLISIAEKLKKQGQHFALALDTRSQYQALSLTNWLKKEAPENWLKKEAPEISTQANTGSNPTARSFYPSVNPEPEPQDTWSTDGSLDHLSWSRAQQRIATAARAAGADPIPESEPEPEPESEEDISEEDTLSNSVGSLEDPQRLILNRYRQAFPELSGELTETQFNERALRLGIAASLVEASPPQAAQADTESAASLVEASPPQAAQADTESEVTFFRDKLIGEGCEANDELIKQAIAMVEEDKKTNFNCPITNALMRHPVCLAQTGHLFEREAIEHWLKEKNTCPVTRARLINKTISTDVHDKKTAIIEALKAAIKIQEADRGLKERQIAAQEWAEPEPEQKEPQRLRATNAAEEEQRLETEDWENQINKWYYAGYYEQEPEPEQEQEQEPKPEDLKGLRASQAKRAADAAEARIKATKE